MMKQRPITNRLVRHLAALFIAAMLPGCDSSSHPESADSGSRSIKAPTSIEDVRKAVVGTWTYTGQEFGYGGQKIWTKWVIKEDGTMDSYAARPTDEDWGKPTIRKWTPVSGKYSDTGKRYFGIRVEDSLDTNVLNEKGNLSFAASAAADAEMTRGDKFPFSK